MSTQRGERPRPGSYPPRGQEQRGRGAARRVLRERYCRPLQMHGSACACCTRALGPMHRARYSDRAGVGRERLVRVPGRASLSWTVAPHPNGYASARSLTTPRGPPLRWAFRATLPNFRSGLPPFTPFARVALGRFENATTSRRERSARRRARTPLIDLERCWAAAIKAARVRVPALPYSREPVGAPDRRVSSLVTKGTSMSSRSNGQPASHVFIGPRRTEQAPVKEAARPTSQTTPAQRRRERQRQAAPPHR